MKKLVVATTLTLALAAAPAAGIAGATESARPDARTEARERPRRAVHALAAAADAIGIAPRALVEELRDGKSIADVARGHGVEPEAVADAVVAAASERIDKAVDAGKLDAERAATIKDRLDERVATLVERDRGERRKHRAARAAFRRHVRRGVLAVTANQLGMEKEALRAELRAGKSIADVARDHGVDPAQIADAVVAAASERIDKAVDAGKLDAERAATIKDRLDERIDRKLDRSR